MKTEQQEKNLQICIYVDVDGTLIQTRDGKSQPDGDVVLQVKKWKSDGSLLYCWSSRGAEYAERIAAQLRIKDCFSAFLCKPHFLIDDQSINDWACLIHLYPAQVRLHSSESLQDLIK